MAIKKRTTYVEPRLLVYQLLNVVQDLTKEHMATCIVGPQYLLQRYGEEDLYPYEFKAEGMSLPFAYEMKDSMEYSLDTSSVEVDVEGLEAIYMTLEKGPVQVDPDDSTVLRTTGYDDFYTSDEATEGAMFTLQRGRPVQIGDIVYVTKGVDGDGNPITKRATVIEVLGRPIPADVAFGDDTPPSFSTDTTVTVGNEDTNTIFIPEAHKDAYFGEETTTYVLTCVDVDEEGSFLGSRWSVTDTAGVDVLGTFYVDGSLTEVPVGNYGVIVGLAADLEGVKCAEGDSFAIQCTAETASVYRFNGIRLDTVPVDATLLMSGADDAYDVDEIQFGIEYTGPIVANTDTDMVYEIGYNEEGEPVLNFESGMAVLLSDRLSGYQWIPFSDGKGDVFVSFRVLEIPIADEDLFYIYDDTDIETNFGTIHPDNDLAYGCAMALDGSAGRPIYVIRTQGITADDFYAAVKKTEGSTATYAFGLLTNDLEVMQRVVEFNQELSTEYNKKWRRTIIGLESPGEYQLATHDTDNNVIRASFTKYRKKTTFCLVQLHMNSKFDFKEIPLNGAFLELYVGDLVQISANGNKYAISAILSSSELVLVEGPPTPITTPTPISVWKADTTQNATDYIGTVAAGFGTRRVTIVWTDAGENVVEDTNPSYEVIPNRFIACEIAGLSSSLLPARAMTRQEITTVTRIPRMYTKYTRLELNEIAAKGVLIIMQDTKDAPTYVRHGLTTEMDKGLLYREESITRNLDNISYAVSDTLEGYIGKANVTYTALRRIQNDMIGLLHEFMNDTTDELVGPSLLRYENLTVEQDPDYLDRVNVNVTYYLPAPLNQLAVYQMVYAARVALDDQYDPTSTINGINDSSTLSD